MYCTKCGSLINSGASFCSNCGTPVLAPQTQPVMIPELKPQAPIQTMAAPLASYAGFWLRFLAFIVDAIAINIFWWLLQVLLIAVFSNSTNFGSNFFSWSIVLWWLYYTLMESSSRQATLGKSMAGLVVTDMEGKRISFARANARFWSKLISSVLAGLGFIMAGVTAKKQALHDIIANTLVLRAAPAGQASSAPSIMNPQTAVPVNSAAFQSQAGQSQINPAIPQQPGPPKQFDITKAMVWVSRAGMLAVLAGIGYFYKLSVDKGWLAPIMRIVIGLGVSGLLLILGDFWRKRIPLYATLMTGGGIPLLYFTVFAAFGWYHLIPQAAGFAALVLVALLATFLSDRYHSVAIAIMALIGAYVTPGLVDIWQAQPLVMYVYFTLLHIFVLFTILDTKEFYLIYLSAIGTAFYYLHLWDTASLGEPNRTFALVFLGLTALLYIAGSAWIFKKHDAVLKQTSSTAHGLSVFYIFASLFYAFAVSALLGMENLTNQICAMYAVGAFIWIGAYILVSRLERKDMSYILLYGGMLFSILAVLYKLHSSIIDVFLGIFGMLAAYCGFRFKLKELRIYGIVLLTVNLFRVLYYDVYPDVFILNMKFFSVAVESVGLSFVGWLLGQPEAEADERKVSASAQIIGALLLWFGFSREIYLHYNSSESMNIRNVLISLWWAIEAVVLISLGAIKAFHPYRKLSVLLFSLAIAKVFLYDAFHLETIYKTVSFIIFGLILLGVSFVFLKNKEKVTEFFGNKTPEIPPKPNA